MNKSHEETPQEAAFRRTKRDAWPELGHHDKTFDRRQRCVVVRATVLAVNHHYGRLLPGPLPLEAIKLLFAIARSSRDGVVPAVQLASRMTIVTVDAAASTPITGADVLASLTLRLEQLLSDLAMPVPAFPARMQTQELPVAV
jgi:hypothetical protein